MAIFRKVHVSFWSDSFISGLDPDQRYFYLYLLTNERTTQCGVYEISLKQMAHDTGYSIDTVSILLRYFISTGKIRYNSTTNEIAVGKWLKYNGSTSPKVQTCINKEFACVKDTVLIEYVKSMDTHPQEEEEQEEEEEKDNAENFSNLSATDNTLNNLVIIEQAVRETKNPIYTRCVEYWLKTIHPDWSMSGAGGKAMKLIIKEITNRVRLAGKPDDEDSIVGAVQYFFTNMPEWFKDKDLLVINSKFNEIFEKIKNGKTTDKQTSWINYDFTKHFSDRNQ